MRYIKKIFHIFWHMVRNELKLRVLIKPFSQWKSKAIMDGLKVFLINRSFRITGKQSLMFELRDLFAIIMWVVCISCIQVENYRNIPE